MSYRTTRNGKGHLVIHDVPIFVTCKRGEFVFDDKWIAAAVAKAKQAEREGYMPPLHVKHHNDGPTEPKPAGYFRVTGTGAITFKDKRRTAIFADLVVTDNFVEMDVLATRLPYRSVEIFNVDKPAVDSLALLDHDPPFLELPMLMVAAPEGETVAQDATITASFANATFANPWRDERAVADDPVVACFRRGRSAHLFFQDEDSMTSNKPIYFDADDDDGKKKKEESKGAQFVDGDGDGGSDDSDDSGGGGLDVGAVVKAIADGSITVADMEEIMTAIREQQAATMPDEEADDPTASVAPAPTPGEAMKKGANLSQKFAVIEGENAALKARLDQRDATDTRDKDIAIAMQRLDGRPLGSNLETKLHTYHTEHGPAAFRSYVDSMAQTFGALAGDRDGTAAAFSGQVEGAPESALAYTELGSTAVESAVQFSREWKELSERGHTRTSEERYVQLNMEREGHKLKKASA